MGWCIGPTHGPKQRERVNRYVTASRADQPLGASGKDGDGVYICCGADVDFPSASLWLSFLVSFGLPVVQCRRVCSFAFLWLSCNFPLVFLLLFFALPLSVLSHVHQLPLASLRCSRYAFAVPQQLAKIRIRTYVPTDTLELLLQLSTRTMPTEAKTDTAARGCKWHRTPAAATLLLLHSATNRIMPLRLLEQATLMRSLAPGSLMPCEKRHARQHTEQLQVGVQIV